jgi:WhiB family redox-sensing transcriptional regulator
VGTTGPALDQAEQAKAVCRVCPVAAHCLEYALYSRQEAGIWGGLDEEERRVLRRARQARKTRRDQARGWRDADGGQG